mmetsp:Transcript_18974/g.38649  ORF Transcript_18974/g.38649 Transcript_18974/m.38649 type:complete len:214 (+) Transcript_18974:3234-3875(+)
MKDRLDDIWPVPTDRKHQHPLLLLVVPSDCVAVTHVDDGIAVADDGVENVLRQVELSVATTDDEEAHKDAAALTVKAANLVEHVLLLAGDVAHPGERVWRDEVHLRWEIDLCAAFAASFDRLLLILLPLVVIIEIEGKRGAARLHNDDRRRVHLCGFEHCVHRAHAALKEHLHARHAHLACVGALDGRTKLRLTAPRPLLGGQLLPRLHPRKV